MKNTSTYPYRIERFNKMSESWKLEKLHDLMLVYKPDSKDITEFRNNIMLYIAKAFYFDSTLDENIFLDRLEENIDVKDNITPNGAVVPKKEYQLEYNLVLRSWSKMIEKLIAPNPSLLYKNRITPNIRIKFGQDPIENKDRGLNTALPHSDAWVESSFGINVFIPIIGDIENNSMDYYVPKDPNNFVDQFLSTAKSYKDMQWVLDYYKMDESLRPQKGNFYFSDFALIHNTSRKNNCRARVSIDTAIYVEKHEPHQERMAEYIDDLKIFGESIFIATRRSIHEENIFNKQTHFSHYTTGTLKVINCEVE